MKIKTSYDCTFEQRDFANMAKGHDLSATLSDGSVAFKFKMDDEVRAALMGGTFTKQVSGVVVDAPRNGHAPRLLTDGKKKPVKQYSHRGDCPHCKSRGVLLEPHIRSSHPDKPLHPNGKFRCTEAGCPQRFATAQGLSLHLRFSHKLKGPASRKEK